MCQKLGDAEEKENPPLGVAKTLTLQRYCGMFYAHTRSHQVSVSGPKQFCKEEYSNISAEIVHV